MADDLPPIERLKAIMARLRDPAGGCPWDLEQSFATIAPYTIEEAYEVADAIRQDDMAALREELGDLLFQVVFHARMAEEQRAFDFDAVAAGIADKMVRRHPHVFGDAPKVADAAAQTANWETVKAGERQAKAQGAKAQGAKAQGAKAQGSVLDGIAALPALLRAVKLQSRAARVGFDWGAPGPVLDKIEEEIGELRREIAAGAGAGPAALAAELGDVLFACVNLARHLGIDPETALGHTNAKFERRFRRIEQWLAAEGTGPEAAGLDRMEALWQRAKQEE